MCLLCGCSPARSQLIAKHAYTLGFSLSDAGTYFVGLAAFGQSINVSDHSALEHKTVADYVILIFSGIAALSILAANYRTYLRHNQNYTELQQTSARKFRYLKGSQAFLKTSGYITAVVRAIVGFAAVTYALSKGSPHIAFLISSMFISALLTPGQFRSSAALYCNQQGRDRSEFSTNAAASSKATTGQVVAGYALSLCFTLGATALYFDNTLKIPVHLKIPGARDAINLQRPSEIAMFSVGCLVILFLFIATLMRYQNLIQEFLVNGGHRRIFKRQADISIFSRAVHVTASVSKTVATYGSLFRVFIWPLMQNIQTAEDMQWTVVLGAHILTIIPSIGRLFSALALYLEKGKVQAEQQPLVAAGGDADDAGDNARYCLKLCC